MTASSFVERNLRVAFTLAQGQGAFGPNGEDQVVLDGLRVVCSVEKYGGLSLGTARLQVYGVRPDVVAQLTQLAFHPLQVKNNVVEVFALEGDAAPVLVYSGTILAAWNMYEGMPDVYLYVEAMAGYFNKLNPVGPTSYQGAVNVAQAMQNLAVQMGYAFENNGVQATLSGQYLPGTAMAQAQRLAENAGIDLYLDDHTLAICPRGQARQPGGSVPLLSKDSGLIGYPTFDKMGVQFRCVYDPDVLFGGMVQIQSSVKQANGTWRVVSLSHVLESQKPGGRWETTGWATDNAVAVVGA